MQGASLCGEGLGAVSPRMICWLPTSLRFGVGHPSQGGCEGEEDEAWAGEAGRHRQPPLAAVGQGPRASTLPSAPRELPAFL